MDKILNSLNPVQKQAVTTTEGPLLVLAGAGTGKTKVLTVRASYIIQQKLALPFQVLAVTFTNKAANEMSKRIIEILGEGARTIWIGTFHSIGLRILRRFFDKLGLDQNFFIVNTEDSHKITKQVLLDNNLDIKQAPFKYVASRIARLKDKGIWYDNVPRAEDELIAYQVPLSSLYEKYSMKLRELNAVDFNDLLLLCVRLFQQNPDILELYQNQFKYILVDEYQDTNVVQYQLIKMLSQGSNNVCCVGDDDQSIYSWRGAEIANILRFKEDYQDAQVLCLEENYRSTTPILETASFFIAKNTQRWGKKLWTAKESGSAVLVQSCIDSTSEARFIAEKIFEYVNYGYKYAEIAILVRAGYQTREIEEALVKNNLPYRMLGSNAFYERLEIKDALAYLRLVVQPSDNISFERIINVPKRGVGEKVLETIITDAYTNNVSYYAALGLLLQSNGFSGKLYSRLSHFYELIQQWHQLIDIIPLPELMEKILEESGYFSMWRDERTEEAQNRTDNLIELLNALKEYDSVNDCLEKVSLLAGGEESADPNKVSIMTLHAAKGLEFPVVFLAGWEEGVFPASQAINSDDESRLEEERRLAYVGITRAKEHLIVSYSNRRATFGTWKESAPSRFIAEMDNKYIKFSHQKSFQHEWPYRSSIDTFQGGKEYQTVSRPQPKLNVSTAANKPWDSYQKYVAGSLVKHTSFGKGRVIKQVGPNVYIMFDEHGEKTIRSDYIVKL